MNELTKRHAKLLEELLRTCLVDHADELRLDAKETGRDAVYFTLEVHADDYRTVCGARGANIKALTFIAEELGLSRGARYRFWLKESVRGEVRPKRVVEPPADFDPKPAAAFLERTIAECLDYATQVGATTLRDGSRTETPPFAEVFTFFLHAPSDEIREKLVEPYEDDREKRTLLESLRALWKAYGARNGVAFALEVA